MGLAALFLAVLVADAVLAGPVPQPEPQQHKQQLAERAELVKYTQSQLDAAEQRLQEARTALIKVRPPQPGPCWAWPGPVQTLRPLRTSKCTHFITVRHRAPPFGPWALSVFNFEALGVRARSSSRGPRLAPQVEKQGTCRCNDRGRRGMLQAPSRGGVGRGGERAAYTASARRVQPAVA